MELKISLRMLCLQCLYCKVKYDDIYLTFFHQQFSFVAEDKGHLFEKKSLPYPDSDPGELSKASKLSQQIENYASSGENQFLEYAKFDGRVCIGFN